MKAEEKMALYNQELGDSVVTPFVSENNYMIYNQYTIRHSKRDALKSHLESKDWVHDILPCPTSSSRLL